jgi:fluoride ion exporter CrcB/FEX
MTPLALAATVGLGALGAILRWLVMLTLPHAPWWSLGIVNITGSAAIGVVAALPEGFWSYPLMMGLAGGLTTFSTLAVLMVPSSKENVARRDVAPLALHVLAGVVACAAGFIGMTAVL